MPIPTSIARAMIRLGVAQMLPSIRNLLGPGVDFLRYFNHRILASPNVELKATRTLLAGGGPGVIDLSLGAPEADAELMALLPSLSLSANESGYPPLMGLRCLRDALATKLLRENHVEADPSDEILVCNGVSQAISLTLDSFVDWGDKVALFDPFFLVYRVAVMNRGAKVATIPTLVDEGWVRFQERDLCRALRGARLVIVNSPSNPTGGMFSAEMLERIAYWCKRYDVLILSDEVYEKFHYLNAPPVSIGSLPAAQNRTVTANSFSKTYAMAAYRVGYLTSCRHLMGPLVVSFLSGTPFVPVVSQRLALAAMHLPAQRHETVRQRFLRRRRLVAHLLARAGIPFSMPGGAFYFWIRNRLGAGKGPSAGEFAARLLADANVRVMPGESSSNLGADFIRLSFAGEEPYLEEGVERLVQFWESVYPRQKVVAAATRIKNPPASSSPLPRRAA